MARKKNPEYLRLKLETYKVQLQSMYARAKWLEGQHDNLASRIKTKQGEIDKLVAVAPQPTKVATSKMPRITPESREQRAASNA